MQTVQDNIIDFGKYLAAPVDAAKVKPASNWCYGVIDRIHGDNALQGIHLPWGKTQSNIRLRPGELSIWAGINGHGKSAMLSQVMLSAMRQDEKVCIASMEMTPVQTMARMTRQAVGVGLPSGEYIRKFHEWTDDRLWLYDQIGTVKSDKLIAVIRYCTEELKIKHFVIDSMMKCGIGGDDYRAQKNFIDELSTHAKDYGMHIHLVAHSRKKENEKGVMDKFDVKGTSEITDMADNVFTVWRNKHKEEEQRKPIPNAEVMLRPDALLICDKQRHGEWEGKVGMWYHRGTFQFLEGDNEPPKQMEFANYGGGNG